MLMKRSPHSFTELRRQLGEMARAHHHGLGLVVLVTTCLLLSFVLALQPQAERTMYAIGEVADRTVIAPRALMVEDSFATQMRRKQVAQEQPTVFDLSLEPVLHLRENVTKLLQNLNETDEEDVSIIKQIVEEALNSPVRAGMIDLWLLPDVQEVIVGLALPWVEKALVGGVVGDVRQALPSRGAMIVRDLEHKSELLRPAGAEILDVPVLLTGLSQVLRHETTLENAKRQSIATLFSLALQPTLTLNREASLRLGEEAAQTVEAILYHVQKGEVIVRQGDRVNHNAQLKLQSLFGQETGMLRVDRLFGLFFMSLVLILALYIAPSGNIGTSLRKKDCLFISLLLAVSTLAAKGSMVLAIHVLDPQYLSIFAYAFPVAGAAGLSSLIFAARRYASVGLLLSLFLSVAFSMDIAYFLFVFVACMFNTWLVFHAQTRQDVVWSFVPLSLGLGLLATIAALFDGIAGINTYGFLWIFAFANGLVSVVLLFAIGPVLEMFFSYTTRFRLMELLSLDHPLLQNLMVSVPGTYHHSLVVANMVEAGAKAVGANAMLCKVAALYHDVGKLAYPDYFIENQYGGENKHDKLSPTMSALILGAHVKKGCELAAEYRLGEEIIDIIRQHHGTSCMRFFFNKAKELGENPSEETFMYPGPRPQTREAAIVMLADVVEASSRTLREPTPARIDGHVDTMLKNIFADGQLDESDLRFKDLYKLSKAFSRILTGIFHQRIAYPADVQKIQEGYVSDKAEAKSPTDEKLFEEKKSANGNGKAETNIKTNDKAAKNGNDQANGNGASKSFASANGQTNGKAENKPSASLDGA